MPATWHFFTEGWWGTGEDEATQEAAQAVTSAEDEDSAYAAMADLQEAYYEYPR